MSSTLLILAGGLGSRYGGLKQLDQVGPSSETLLEYAVYDAIRSGFTKAVFIIQEFFAQEFKQKVTSKFNHRIKVDFIDQNLSQLPSGFSPPSSRKKPWGTAHAIWIAHSVIHDPFVVINADDFYGPTSFGLITNHLKEASIQNSDDYAIVVYPLGKTLSSHGAVTRGICKTNKNYLQSILEQTGITKTPQGAEYKGEKSKTITLTGKEPVNVNLWYFTPSIFKHLEDQFAKFLNNLTDPLNQEFYITTQVSKLIKQKQASVKVIPTQEQWFGITYPSDKSLVVQKLQQLVNQGVYPQNLWSYTHLLEKY